MKDYTKKNINAEVTKKLLKTIPDDYFENVNENKIDYTGKFTYYLYHYYNILYKYREKTDFEGYHLLKKVTFEIKNKSTYLFGGFFILNFDRIFQNEIGNPKLLKVIDARDFLFCSLSMPVPFLLVPSTNLNSVEKFYSAVNQHFGVNLNRAKQQIYVFEDGNVHYLLMSIGAATYLNLDFFINDVMRRADIYNVFLGFAIKVDKRK